MEVEFKYYLFCQFSLGWGTLLNNPQISKAYNNHLFLIHFAFLLWVVYGFAPHAFPL